MVRRLEYYIHGKKNPVLLVFLSDFGRPDHLGDRFGSVFVEKGSYRSDGGLSKDGRRGRDGSDQHTHLEPHQFRSPDPTRG